jgi:glyoxylase-like metal-dependent hydrolase (beta-lactamase superfamily II)
MKRTLVAACSILVSAFGLLSCATGPSHQSLVDRAVRAMGGAEALGGLRTVSAKGTTRQWEPEQSDAPGGEMRYANEARFETSADRGARASRIDYVKNFAYPAPRTFTYSEIVTPQAGYVIGVDTNGRNAQSMKANPPAHTMSGLRLASTQRESRRANVTSLLLDMRNNPDRVGAAADVSHNGRNLPAVSYGEFIVAFDPRTGLPELVRTLDYDNVWGDVTYDLHYSDWSDVSGVKVPMTRRMELNGRLISHTSLSEVRFNQPVDTARLQIPSALLATAAKPATGAVPYQWVLRRQFIGTYMDSDHVAYDTQASSPGLRLQDVAPGVSQTQGGTHHSLIVEMADHLIVFDAPVTDAQSMWVVNAARQKYPNKPIRHVVLTHHHMDHSGGLRGFLAQGASLVVGQGAGAHWRRVLAAPATRNPDLKNADLSRTQVIEIADRQVFSDGKRQVMAILMDSPHAKGTLMGYVPDARLGFVTDIWSPGIPLPAKPNPGLVAVVNAVKKANIQPERFAGGHGSTADYASLARLAGQ